LAILIINFYSRSLWASDLEKLALRNGLLFMEFLVIFNFFQKAKVLTQNTIKAHTPTASESLFGPIFWAF
jgi:hypothetical protein